MHYGILLILLVPVIALAVWAACFLATRKPTHAPPPGRDDSTERPELTGTEQQKHRHPV